MKIVFLVLFLFSAVCPGFLKASESFIFTLSADVEKTSVISLPKDIVVDYIRNLDIYSKFFPDVVSVTKINEKDSEWLYRIKAPLASAYNLSFLLADRSPSRDTLILESKDSTRDNLYCKAVFKSLDDNRTQVTMRFHIVMSRDKASDVHFMAGLLGENFLCARMKEKLEGDMETFITSVTKEMYLANRESRGN
jgi:uncharacterized membrane protein